MAIFTWTLVLAMYLIKLTLWFIDARNMLASLNTVLVQHSSDTLAEKRLRANESSTELGVVEDVLYAFMVRFQSSESIL